MNFNMYYDSDSGQWNFNGSVTTHDLANLNLTRCERVILDLPIENAVDALCALEIVFRNGKE